MKLIYTTSIAFSNKMANRTQVHAMAKQFQRRLGNNFCLGVNYINVDDKNINIICFNTNKSYFLAFKYLRFIKNNNFDFVYCREARLLFFIILYNKLFYKINLKFAYEIHSLLHRSMVDKLVDKFLSQNVNYFIFVTRNLADKYVAKYKADKNKILVSPDGVDLEIFDINISKEDARLKLNLPPSKKIIAYTGKFKTMGMDKGINNILDSIKIMNDPGLLFVAVGGSKDELSYYKDRAEELSVLSQVKLFGLTTQSELAIYQKAADALLMPFPYNEHYAYFMSPLKMFEYMASGRPIVASDLPSIKEVLNEGNSAMVKAGDASDLARVISDILNNKDKAKNLSERAYSDVHNFTWEKRVDNLLRFVEK